MIISSIMSHLHPGSMKTALWEGVHRLGQFEGQGIVERIPRRRPACDVLIHMAANASQLWKDLPCLQLFVGSAQFV